MNIKMIQEITQICTNFYLYKLSWQLSGLRETEHVNINSVTDEHSETRHARSH